MRLPDYEGQPFKWTHIDLWKKNGKIQNVYHSKTVTSGYFLSQNSEKSILTGNMSLIYL